MTKCKICGQKFALITNTHLTLHNWDLSTYAKKFGIKGCGFLRPNLLPKDDPRYKRWKESLKKRPAPWSKGFTKETHPSIAKMVRTFKRKRIDNFAEWRKKAVKLGILRVYYPPFKKTGDLAELIGVILGDGHIEKFPRAEGLTIACNSNNPGFINRYADLVKKFFDKKPYVKKINEEEGCTRIRVYQKDISKRLRIPTGNRGKIVVKIPKWILESKCFLKRYLRGLYEAEGSFCVHKPTCTYKFLFSNRNQSLLNNVYRGLRILGFHPHASQYKIQVSRREEVYRVKDLLRFRQY
jgi:hypothetical protein